MGKRMDKIGCTGKTVVMPNYVDYNASLCLKSAAKTYTSATAGHVGFTVFAACLNCNAFVYLANQRDLLS
jgi:hypothetical protein